MTYFSRRAAISRNFAVWIATRIWVTRPNESMSKKAASFVTMSVTERSVRLPWRVILPGCVERDIGSGMKAEQ